MMTPGLHIGALNFLKDSQGMHFWPYVPQTWILHDISLCAVAMIDYNMISDEAGKEAVIIYG